MMSEKKPENDERRVYQSMIATTTTTKYELTELEDVLVLSRLIRYSGCCLPIDIATRIASLRENVNARILELLIISTLKVKGCPNDEVLDGIKTRAFKRAEAKIDELETGGRPVEILLLEEEKFMKSTIEKKPDEQCPRDSTPTMTQEEELEEILVMFKHIRYTCHMLDVLSNPNPKPGVSLSKLHSQQRFLERRMRKLGSNFSSDVFGKIAGRAEERYLANIAYCYKD
jgi:hypothetical protein